LGGVGFLYKERADSLMDSEENTVSGHKSNGSPPEEAWLAARTEEGVNIDRIPL